MRTDILSEIADKKKIEIEGLKQIFVEARLRDWAEQINRPAISMKESLQSSASGIIAEFKRKSPSKGWIKEDSTPDAICPSYEANGASALSILTNTDYFGGYPAFVERARPLVHLPILMKEFVVDEYQLYQARIIGADAVLLIAACLTKETCLCFAKLAHALSLEVLLEVHDAHELEYINEYVDMVGVNNRNLGTFHTDVENSFRLANSLPKDMLKVSESGISDAETIRRLRAEGFRGFLIGETFMKTENPGNTLHELIQQVTCN